MHSFEQGKCNEFSVLKHYVGMYSWVCGWNDENKYGWNSVTDVTLDFISCKINHNSHVKGLAWYTDSDTHAFNACKKQTKHTILSSACDINT